MAFKRVLKAKTAFKTYSAKLSPEVQKEWENKFTEKGLFQLREQTAQVRLLHHRFSLTLSDRFMFHDGTDRELASFGEFLVRAQSKVLEADMGVPQRRDDVLIAKRTRTIDQWF